MSLSDHLGPAFQRIRQNADQELEEFHQVFLRLPDKNRASLKAWLHKANELRNEMDPIWDLVPFAIEYKCSISDEEGNAVYDGSFHFSPRILLAAIAAWERGELYAPNGIDFR